MCRGGETMDNFYNGNILLSKKDINNNTPDTFIVTSNRSDGKTTFFRKFAADDYLRHNHETIFLTRYNSNIKQYSSDILETLHNHTHIKNLVLKNYKTHSVININNKPAIYISAFNSSEHIRNTSNMYNNVYNIIVDEFQSEIDNYVPREITKLQSIRTSIERGKNQHTRYTRLILCGNPYDILNPYYVALGISDRITPETKWLRGTGWVLQQRINQEIINEWKNKNNTDFDDSDYVQYAILGQYKNDYSLIEKIPSNCEYIATLIINKNIYGIRAYSEFIHISKKYDPNFKNVFNDNINDKNSTYFTQSDLYNLLKLLNINKKLMFDNLETKSEILKILK